MATSPATVESILTSLAGAGNVRARAMFGEYGLYCDEKIVALICDNRLFVKPTEAGGGFLDGSHGAPPYPGAKNYLLVPESKINDASWLSTFIRATADALPAPKPKPKKISPR